MASQGHIYFTDKQMSRIVLFFWFIYGTTDATEVPPSPYNVSLVKVHENGATMGWMVQRDHHRLAGFELTFLRRNASEADITACSHYILQIDSVAGQYTMDVLSPLTEYEFFMKSYSHKGIYSQPTDSIIFVTLPRNTTCAHCVTIRPFEAVVVIIIFFAWMTVLGSFLHYWNELHMNDSNVRYMRRAKPKNLSSVQIVRDPSKSLIQRTYSNQINKIMAARERRIERFNSKTQLLGCTSLEETLDNNSLKDKPDVLATTIIAEMPDGHSMKDNPEVIITEPEVI